MSDKLNQVAGYSYGSRQIAINGICIEMRSCRTNSEQYTFLIIKKMFELCLLQLKQSLVVRVDCGKI